MFCNAITIYVSFYNQSNKEIDRCLKSIEEQSNKNFLCKVIDDFSKPETSHHIRSKCKLYGFIYIKNSKNKGVCGSRNVAINDCETNYIAFIDGDDFIDKEYVAQFYNKTKNSFPDLIFLGINRISAELQPIPTSEYKVCTKHLIRTDSTAIWEKIYRTVFIKSFLFGAGWKGGYEDVYFSLLCYYYCNSYEIIPLKLYNYISNPSSLSNTIEAENSQKLSLFYVDQFLKKINYKISAYDLWTIYANFSFFAMRKVKNVNWENFYFKNYNFALVLKPAVFLKSFWIYLCWLKSKIKFLKH